MPEPHWTDTINLPPRIYEGSEKKSWEEIVTQIVFEPSGAATQSALRREVAHRLVGLIRSARERTTDSVRESVLTVLQLIAEEGSTFLTDPRAPDAALDAILCTIFPPSGEVYDENGCYTLPNGDCASEGPCIHTPASAQTSDAVSSLAARVLNGYNPTPEEARTLAASCLRQDETKGPNAGS